MRRFHSQQEKAELVAQYMVVHHGQKAGWLRERGLDPSSIRKWRRAYLFGDLEWDLTPRDTSDMTLSDGVRLQQLELQLAAERAARTADQQDHQAEVDRLNKVNDALGKAIGLLHDRAGVQGPTDGS